MAPELSTIRENMTRVSLRPGWGGNTGTATILAFRHAIKAIVKSNEGGYTNTALIMSFVLENK